LLRTLSDTTQTSLGKPIDRADRIERIRRTDIKCCVTATIILVTIPQIQSSTPKNSLDIKLFKISSSLFQHGVVCLYTSLAFADIVLVIPIVTRTHAFPDEIGFLVFVFSGTGPAIMDAVSAEQGVVHED
jgi:hypothetical protein